MATEFAAGPESVPFEDDVLRALSEESRRRVLLTLRGSGPLGVRALATALDSERPVARPRMVGEQTVETIARLHHVDLPKLVAAGLVEREDGDVRLTARGDASVAWLASARSGTPVVDQGP